MSVGNLTKSIIIIEGRDKGKNVSIPLAILPAMMYKAHLVLA
jgi:hypothetical protein